MDVLTSEQRSRCMSAIRGKDTKPEMAIRRLVHSLGYRYRLHVRKLPGAPDLVFAGRRKVIFVHGCFWHRHACSLGSPMPASRPEFWSQKFDDNVRRDARNVKSLRTDGWDVLVVWECEVRRGDLLAIARKLKRFLDKPARVAKGRAIAN